MAAASAEKASNEEAKASASEELAATEKTLAAIEKAKSILEDGVKVFLQVEAKTLSSSDDEKREQVARLMRSLASKTHGFQLAQLAAAAKSDPFGKVRGLIEAMIDRLEKEAAEEATAKSFCDSETSKSKKKQADLTADADMHAARIEKATAAKATLEQQIKGLQKDVADMDASESEATKLRQEEHAAFLKASSDFK